MHLMHPIPMQVPIALDGLPGGLEWLTLEMMGGIAA
jgi:hypothetical protein